MGRSQSACIFHKQLFLHTSSMLEWGLTDTNIFVHGPHYGLTNKGANDDAGTFG